MHLAVQPVTPGLRNRLHAILVAGESRFIYDSAALLLALAGHSPRVGTFTVSVAKTAVSARQQCAVYRNRLSSPSHQG